MVKAHLELQGGEPVAWLLEPELRPGREIPLGDALKLESLLVDLRGWIGEAPQLLDAETVASRFGADPTTWTAAKRPEFRNAYLMTTFGVDRVSGLVTPDGAGLEVALIDSERDLNVGHRLHVHSVFPSARYKVVYRQRVSGEVALDGSFAARVAPPGQLEPVPGVEGLGDFAGMTGLDASAGVRAEINTSGELNFGMQVHAPIVEAIGEGDTRAQWVFHDSGGPIVGKSLLTVMGVTLPREREELEVDARMFLVFKVGPYPVRRYSSWLRLNALV